MTGHRQGQYFRCQASTAASLGKNVDVVKVSRPGQTGTQAQLVVAVVLAVSVGLITQRAGWLWSVAYGAAAVVIPAALFARGLRVQLGAGQENLAMVRFFGLEIAKLVLTVVLLLLAPLVVPGLNWLALVLGLVVVMKTYWLALWLLTRSE